MVLIIKEMKNYVKLGCDEIEVFRVLLLGDACWENMIALRRL